MASVANYRQMKILQAARFLLVRLVLQDGLAEAVIVEHILVEPVVLELVVFEPIFAAELVLTKPVRIGDDVAESVALEPVLAVRVVLAPRGPAFPYPSVSELPCFHSSVVHLLLFAPT